MTQQLESLAHETLDSPQPFWPARPAFTANLPVWPSASRPLLAPLSTLQWNTEGGPNLHVALLFALLCVMTLVLARPCRNC
ncbi:hypothetical protein ACPA9J_36130 [Pseudomonas aeruginosa]